MYEVSEQLKELYRTDTVPKTMVAEFRRQGESAPFLTISDNTRFFAMSIEESLSSGENIEYGSCEASEVKLTVKDVPASIKNSEMTLRQIIGGRTLPFGKYVIQSVEKQENSEFRDIKGLDYMSKFDIDVVSWYNSLSFPLTLQAFRASLCTFVGVSENIPDYLPNDNMPVHKTVDTLELSGRQVLIACEQVNGSFGHFDRNGVLQHIILQPNDRLVPASDLYPSSALYPQAPGEMNTQIYDESIEPHLLISCTLEEYAVKSIDKVQIRQESGDIGALYGNGTNCYTLEGNFLLYGKTAAELNQIAMGIYGMISGRIYTPYEAESKGLPYLEVGDAIRLGLDDDAIVSYIMKRTMKGIYALRDSYSATGEEIRSVQSDINADITQLKGRAAFLVKSVDEVSAKLIDVEKNVEAQFKVTAEQISSTVKRLSEAESSIKQTAEKIELKVSKGEISSALSLESDKVTLTSNRLIVDSTNFKLDGNGNASFSGNITAGATITGATMRAGFIDGTEIDIGTFHVSNDVIKLGDFYSLNDDNGVFRSQDKNIIIQADGGELGSGAKIRVRNGDVIFGSGYSLLDLYRYVHGGGWEPCKTYSCSSDDCDDCPRYTCSQGDCTGDCPDEIPIECDIEGCGTYGSCGPYSCGAGDNTCSCDGGYCGNDCGGDCSGECGSVCSHGCGPGDGV